jgi:hypothetical protein
MMRVDKSTRLTFFVIDRSGCEGLPLWMCERKEINYREDLTATKNAKKFLNDTVIVAYAHYLKKKFKDHGMKDPFISIEGWVSFNERPWQAYIDPNVDLGEVTYRVGNTPGFLPIATPFSEKTMPVLKVLLAVAGVSVAMGAGWALWGAIVRKSILSSGIIIPLGFLFVLSGVEVLKKSYEDVVMRVILWIAIAMFLLSIHHAYQMSRSRQKHSWIHWVIFFWAVIVVLALAMAFVLTLHP